MKRKLLTQMMHEWRDNLWIMLGLAIISLAIWLFCSGLFSVMRYYFLPVGFDDEDVYSLSVNTLYPGLKEYVDLGDNANYINRQDINVLRERIEQSPNVEAAGLISWGGPYSGSNSPRIFYLADEENDTLGYSAALVNISPEVISVFKLSSLTGKDEVWLKKKLDDGEILITPDPTLDEKRKLFEKLNSRYDRWGFSLISRTAEEMNGRSVYCQGDTTTTYHVADIIQVMRANHFDAPTSGNAFQKIDENGKREVRNILIRVKPGCGDKFREELKSNPELRRMRNIYLSDYTKFSENGDVMERGYKLNVRLYLTLIGFFLIILFLGLLGTFWFRVQQRVGEIAIRRVCGASRREIFRRIIGEGMLLLAGSSVIAGVVGWILVKKALIIKDFSTAEVIWFEIATIVIVALGIIISVAYPARKAMNVEPAEAVRDE